MPFDVNNNELHAGDTVMVPLRVVATNPSNKGANLVLESIEGAEGPNHVKVALAINSRQVSRVPAVQAPALPVDPELLQPSEPAPAPEPASAE